MQTSKTSRNGPSDTPQRISPATPRSSRVAKTGGNETDSTGITPTRTPTERSPKVTERRSPRSPITEKKRPSRLSELESKVSQLQDELKKAKEQLNSSETRRRHTQQEVEEAKKHEQVATTKLEDLKRQLVEFSAAEESRLQELCNVQQERDHAWQSELEALQKQQSVDATALTSAMSEIQRLKQQVEATTQSDAARAKQREYAESELEGLRQEMELRLATIEVLKVNVGESDKAAAEANATATETKQQLETAKSTIDSLLAESARWQECLRLKDTELSESKARIVSLEEDLKNTQAAGNEPVKEAQDGNADGGFGSPEPEALKKLNGSCGSSDPEIEHLRTALEVAEIRYQEEQTRTTIETKTAYEMLENVKSDCARKVCDLELELKNKNDELMEVKAALAGKAQDLHRPDGMSEMQPELEAKLMKSITDIAELKASLMDKENALQSVMEENETLKSEAGRKETEVQRRYEAAVAELELAKAAEQDVRMRLGYVTEEADKSSRRAARASEQLDAAQVASSEMEAELRRLRVQSDQWRKAAEAAAAALTGGNGGGNNGRTVEARPALAPRLRHRRRRRPTLVPRAMRRHSPPYHSPPRRGHGGRGRSPPRRSPPRRGYGGRGGRKEQGAVSLLVRNIPLSCRPEDLRVPFERFGPVRDVYLPRDYYSGQPRGFAFVEFVDSYDASEAQYHMNRQMFSGREITVVLASETRKRPEDMSRRTRVRGYSDHEDRRTSRYGRSGSHSRSRSRSPRHRGRARSRSYSPAPRRRDDYSASPKRKEERRAKSPGQSKEHDVDKKQRSYTPDDRNDRRDADNGYKEKSTTPDGEGSRRRRRRSPMPSPGSRSRSADESPAHSN